MLIYAHRGASARLPENTLLAFRGAIEDGADGVELDVHAAADGVPVVIHDRDLARTTDGRGPVDSLPLSEILRLDAGQGETIPTLTEALALLAGRLRLDVEVKQPGIEREVLAALAIAPAASWAISSFDWQILRTLRALDRAAELWPLAEVADDRLIAVAVELGAPTIALGADAYTAEAAARLAEAGLGVMVWTVDDPIAARRFRDLGAGALCTNAPAAIRHALAGG